MSSSLVGCLAAMPITSLAGGICLKQSGRVFARVSQRPGRAAGLPMTHAAGITTGNPLLGSGISQCERRIQGGQHIGQTSQRPGRSESWSRSRNMTTAAADGEQAAVEEPPAAGGSEQEEEATFWSRIQEHQRSVPRLTSVEEARVVVRRCSRAMLSTYSQKFEGYPFGSMVGFAADEFGRPILAISSLSPHTADLENDSRCSLLVSKDPTNQSETAVTIVGDALLVPDGERASARETFLKKHPNAFWVDFGDFRFVRIQPKKVRLTGNIATFAVGASVAEFDAENYAASAVDFVSDFEAPIANHMNADHEDATIAMVEKALGVKVPSAKILYVDRLGFLVEVPLKDQLSRIRLPFPREAASRKDVKDLIVEMTRASKT